MTREQPTVVHLTPDAAEYFATVIEMGILATGRQSITPVIEKIQDAVSECLEGAEIRIGAHQ